MKRHRFLSGLLLSLAGLAIIVVAGMWKPPINLPWNQWKARIAPVHLAWMAGSAICALGLILILSDTFSASAAIDSAEREKMELREDILSMLPRTTLSPQELNELIADRYSKTGILSLTAAELRDVRSLVECRLNGRNSF